MNDVAVGGNVATASTRSQDPPTDVVYLVVRHETRRRPATVIAHHRTRLSSPSGGRVADLGQLCAQSAAQAGLLVHLPQRRVPVPTRPGRALPLGRHQSSCGGGRCTSSTSTPARTSRPAPRPRRPPARTAATSAAPAGSPQVDRGPLEGLLLQLQVGLERAVPRPPGVQRSSSRRHARVSSARLTARISSMPWPQVRVLDRHHRLDPAVQVPGHQVGRADEVDRRAGAARRWRTGRSASAPGSARRRCAPGCCPTARAPRAAGSRCRGRSGRSARRPADAAYSSSIMSASTRLFIFMMMWPVPGARPALAADQLDQPGAQRVGSHQQLAVVARRGRSRSGS